MKSTKMKGKQKKNTDTSKNCLQSQKVNGCQEFQGARLLYWLVIGLTCFGISIAVAIAILNYIYGGY